MTQHYPPPPTNQHSPYSPYPKVASNLHYWTSSFGSCQTQAQPQLHGQSVGASSAALQRAANSPPAAYPNYTGPAYYASDYPAPSQSSSSYVRNGYGDALGGGSNSFVADDSHYGGAARSAPPPPAAALALPALGYEHYPDQRRHHDGSYGAQGSAPVASRGRLGDSFYVETTASQPAPELAVRARHGGPHVQHDYARTNNASLQHILRDQTVSHPSDLAAPVPTAGHDQLGHSANPQGFQDVAGPQSLPGPSDMTSYPVTHHRSAVTRPLNDSSYSVPALQARPAHTSHAWSAGQPAAYTSAAPHDSYTNTPLVRGSVDTSPDSFTGSEWSMLSGEVGGSKSPVYELDADPEWMLLEPHADAHALRPAQEPVHNQVSHHVPPLVFAPEAAPLPARQGAKKTSARKDKPPKVSSSYTQRAIKSKVSKRSNKLSEDAKANASTVRSIGSCARCRFYKNKCDDGMPCRSCLKSVANARVYKIPCTREKLEDVALVRRCNGRFAQDAATFITDYPWIEGTMFDMVFMWNLPPSGDLLVNPSQIAHPPIRVRCQRYASAQTELDTTSSPWKDATGNVRDVSQAPYAIYDTANFQMQVHQYLMSIMPLLEEEVFSRMRNDDLASLTWREAGRFRRDHNSELLDICKKILCLSMVSQGYGNVLSEDIPGVRKYEESGYPHMGYTLYEAYNRSSHDRPLPTAMNHSWDVAVLFLLKDLETKALRLLTKKIFGASHKSNIPWYEIYLAYFLLVWNMAFIKASAKRYIESKSDTPLESQVRAIVSRQMADWDRSFPLLLVYWQGVLRGYEPFMLARENPEELRLNGHVDELGFRYIRDASAILERKGIDRHQPPLIAPSPTSSPWIKHLVREAGAKY